MWFVELTEDRVGRITMAGEITEFPIPAGSEPLHIAAGPDGALWLTAPGRNRIGRMATDGSYTEFPIPSSDAEPSGITAGPDGAMWFTEAFRNQIGRITTDGVVTAELPIPSPASEPRGITVGGDDNVWFTGFNTGTIGRVNLANACGDPDTNLCLNDGRFQVSASWRKTNGETGIAHAIALTEDSGYFWFFDSTNIELVVKALNACGINDHFWVFAAGLTNVEVELNILDTVSGTVAEYLNPQSTAFRPIQDTSAFSTCPAHLQSGDREASEAAVLESDPSALPSYSWTEVRPLDAIGPCVASATAICLNGRFQVESTWLKASGDTGPGHPIQLTADSGYFWFFNPENVELITKVLGGCGINQHQWVFAGGLTNVQVELTVTDTQTGAVQHYINPQGTAFQPIQDTSAFSTCP